MKDILVIGPVPPPSFGVSFATKITVDGLRARGRTVTHFDTSDRRDIKNIGLFDFTNACLGLKHLATCFNHLFHEQYRWVYLPISQGSWGYFRDALFVFLGFAFRRKIAVHLRGGAFRAFYDQTNPIMKVLIRASLKRADICIVQGNVIVPQFDGMVPRTRIKVIPNGVEPGRFPYHERIGYKPIKRILFLSNLQGNKGFLDLLRAAPEILKKRKDVVFAFAGEWVHEEWKQEAHRLVREYRIEKHVRFLGPVQGERKIRLLSRSDIFVFPPSMPEGHPWVVLEAMAVGLPIVTTNQGCIGETVQDGHNGYLVNKRDPRDIAEKVLRLLEDEPLRIRMGRANRQRIVDHFSEKIFLDRLNEAMN
jgi:glycosyltransferase involved in cell wall biosynthesis